MGIKIKRLKKPSLKVLDKLLSRVVCLRAGGRLTKDWTNGKLRERHGGGKCWICGKQGSQAAHIFSKKAFPKSRYDFTNNVRWTCYSCHKGSKYSMHENPTFFIEWYDKKHGEGSFAWLKSMVYLAETTSQKLDPFAIRIMLEKEIEWEVNKNE